MLNKMFTKRVSLKYLTKSKWESKLLLLCGMLTFGVSPIEGFANDLIPMGEGNNSLYYKIGGGSNYALPPVQSTSTINLNTDADLSSGYSCGAFNPLTSLTNTFNNLKGQTDSMAQSLMKNATGSLAEMPMYLIARADPDFYNMLNNFLMGAHNDIDLSTKACQQVKQEISQGKNPYEDWGTIAVNHQWKQKLGTTVTGDSDINAAKADIDKRTGDDGVPWVQGSKDPNTGEVVAGGADQNPINVVGDTVVAGYNALVNNPDLTSNAPAPTGSELANVFKTPSDAKNWIVNVVGDQVVTTCTNCTPKNAGVAGRGLLPGIPNIANDVRDTLGKLVSRSIPINSDNLSAVSADGVMISPQVITAIQSMDPTQQGIMVNKLAQEVATQKTIDKALLARNILQTGSQVPVIAANHPAQAMLEQSINVLDKDIQSLSFESQIRKQMTSETISSLLSYQQNQQAVAAALPKTAPAVPFISGGAVASPAKSK